MNDKIDLLKRLFYNRYSRADYIELRKLLLSRDEELQELMRAHWNEFDPAKAGQYKELSDILDEINCRMKEKPESHAGSRFLRIYSRIASMLIIPLLLVSGILYVMLYPYLRQKDVYVEVTSPTGARTSLVLPDGSTVWLNGDSKIRYPSSFVKNRRIALDGEAFFRVHGGEKEPFEVEAKGIYVMATGTEFDVVAYNDDFEVSVILKEGEVTVLDNRHSTLQKMEAGWRFDYSKSTADRKYAGMNAAGYTSWIEGRLVFENATMEDIMKRMERWYGVDITIKDDELKQLHFKATFESESFEESLKLLQSIVAFNYCFVTRKQRADGSYEHPEVVISRSSYNRQRITMRN